MTAQLPPNDCSVFFCKFEKSISTINESIKKEVEFQGVFKKNSYEISMGLGF